MREREREREREPAWKTQKADVSFEHEIYPTPEKFSVSWA
jgi:hypothetical protein